MDNLLAQGVELAIYGMGTVFVFLALLIIATQAMSSLISRLSPEKAPAAAGAETQSISALDQGRLVAVISAAIAQHRNTNH
jgi:oxaloacetate decarboxylase gamma subunit